MPKLYAISDIHLGFARNREALESLRPRTMDDWLILAGDVGETRDHLARAFVKATSLFARVIWVPGNHELWTVGAEDLRGEAKYRALVELCREFGVLTPEDPYPLWTGEGGPCLIAPLFLLYDYSFRPPGIPPEKALAWAREAGIVCADEARLHPDPYPSREDWCTARCDTADDRKFTSRRRQR